MAASRNVHVVTGTTREGRFSERVADWVMAHLEAQPGVNPTLVDLRDHPLPFFYGVAPARFPREYATEEVGAMGRLLDGADAFILLTAEYNHGYPAVLKNAMDWTFVEWRRKPVAFVGWGNVGGARAIEQLREVAVEFEMAPLRHAVHVLPDVMIAARKPDTGAEVFAGLEPRLQLLLDDLLWWTDTLTAGRARAE